MGIFARLSDIVTANVNLLLDKAEDPERMLAQVIREMEDGLAASRRHGAIAIAAERRLGRELDQNHTAAEHYREQARLALTHQREDLARQALGRKLEHDDLAQVLEGQYTSARATGNEVRAALHALEARLAEARRKQRILTARHRAARIRIEVRQSAAASVPAGRSTFARFARFEEKLVATEDRLVAEAELTRSAGELETELSGLENKKRIDDALAALRRELTAG